MNREPKAAKLERYRLSIRHFVRSSVESFENREFLLWSDQMILKH